MDRLHDRERIPVAIDRVIAFHAPSVQKPVGREVRGFGVSDGEGHPVPASLRGSELRAVYVLVLNVVDILVERLPYGIEQGLVEYPDVGTGGMDGLRGIPLLHPSDAFVVLGVPQRRELAHRIEGLPHVRRDILCGRDPSGGDECHGEVRVHRVEFEDIESEFPDHSPVDRLSEHPAGLFLLPAQPCRGTRIPSGQVRQFYDIRLDLNGLIRQIVGFVVELDRPVADRHVLPVDRGERVDVPVRSDDVCSGTALLVGIGDLEHPLAQIRCRYPSVRVGHGV